MAWGDPSQSLARTLVTNLADLGVLVVDRDLRIVLAEGAALTELLVSAASEGRTPGDVLPAELAGRVESALRRAVDGESTDLDYTTPFGATLRVRVAPTTAPGGGMGGAIAILRDATVEARSARQLDLVFDQLPAPTVLVDSAGRVLRTSAALRRLLGRPGEVGPDADIGSDLDSGLDTDQTSRRVDLVLPPADIDAAVAERARLLSGEVDRARYDIRLGPAVEIAAWRLTAYRVDLDGIGPCLLGQVEPAADPASAAEPGEELPAWSSHPDRLTGLPDRGFLLRRLERALARARRGRRLALLCCDLHGMRRINETLGRPAGDEVLAAVAERIVGDVRHWDTAARLGGDEFAVLCEDAGAAEDVDSVSRRLRELVGRPMRVAEHNVAVGVTITIAVSDGAETGAQLLHRAEQQMYAARAADGVVPPPRDASR